MIITGTAAGETLPDTMRRDKLSGGDGADIFALNRDNKRDFILDFADGFDKIDLSAFRVTFDEVFIKRISADTFVFTIRGESNNVTFAPTLGGPIGLSADDFIFDPGAAPPSVNLISDTAAKDKLFGTSRPDVFLFNPDGTRDAVRNFELGKDQIDLQTFDTNFGALVMVDVRPGRVRLELTTELGTEAIFVTDGSKAFTSADFGADDFIF
ncbi:hypothetical protein LGT41_0000855 [Abyssibius alkaniclasticus]|uniref:hypothetical protein n=1 Tax=Abyssibius alkaniclasticus TaxID=2881234 RepID=UPI0023646263|nr:hypothetical protein [Abyssibius alkaniclasticus]UPH71395.1 hypothetical protein LGT41_0000855 [Abyssibius alkaniclasticus]|tara:strand:- start:1273 stop:1905 length:633 start_codon:yes stop_codon:yes gene_type:complete